MKLLDFLTSTRRPPDGTPKLSPQQVMNAIWSLNRPTAPYHIVSGRAEGVDLIAEWKIVDAQWFEAFAKAGIQYRAFS